MIAYTYLLGWSKLNRWYYGCRYADGCHPDDLWVTYFTSSKHVKRFVETNGTPDTIQVRKIFEDIVKCRKWEEKVLRRLKVLENDKWLNKCNGIVFYSRKHQEPWNKGKTKVTDSRIIQYVEKMRITKTGRNYLPREVQSRGGTTSGNAAVKNRTGIHALAPEQTMANAIKAKDSFINKMSIPEFRELHAMKIRYGRLKKRFDRLKYEQLDSKTFLFDFAP